MTQAEHEKRLRKIEVETEEIKRQIMQFEFQHKKDVAEVDRRLQAALDRSQRQLDHLIQLVGLTDDELDENRRNTYRDWHCIDEASKAGKNQVIDFTF